MTALSDYLPPGYDGNPPEDTRLTAGARASVVDSLLADIERRGNHLNTGALGTSVLLRELPARGHPDVAHAIATQRTYPSWGYWFDHGADAMWEMWPLDSRSRDHFFQGTAVQWLYESVAGLCPGNAGYRTFTVRPDGARASTGPVRRCTRCAVRRRRLGPSSTGRPGCR
ncbi:hypothetical protein ACFWFF_00170 [Streptomyces sp. NPDC060223]|uniref:alpha-L-rhamnosidase-related protein n=1 Tax=unclassified Streptomyces TaxID=2593676 RepID=UPI00363B034E